MAYDYSTYFQYQRRKNLSLILQIGFLLIGALLIIAFALLVNEEPQKVDALLSPLAEITETSSRKTKRNYNYKLLWTDSKKIIYKEENGSDQTIRIINLSTNLSDNIVGGKRVGFGGFLEKDTILFLEDKEGLGRFIVSKYNLVEKTTDEFLAFQAPKNLPTTELDNLVAVSPDKTKLAFAHESGIVLYTLRNEKETTILENSGAEYRKPLFLDNNTLLIYQSAVNILTPIIVDVSGNILTVLPSNLKNLTPSQKGFPIIGVAETGDSVWHVEPKNTTMVLSSEKGKKYTHAIWMGSKEFVIFTRFDNLPTIIKTDKSGKKKVVLAEFAPEIDINDLISDINGQTIYFTTILKNNSSFSVTFYKMGIKDDKPVGFYSINKNL